LTLLITMGDPVGIGPEIVARAFQRGAAEGCVVVGDVGVMRRAMALLPEPWPTAQLESPDEAAPPRCLPVWQPDGMPAGLARLPWGRVDARAGAAAAACIEAAVRAVQGARARAIVTAPIHKGALAAAGVPYPGHTEMLQALAGGMPVRMMLANDELSVVLVTIHQSLRSAIDAVTFDAVLQTLRIAHANLAGSPAATSGGVGRRIAVAGLNPHAGEDGLFGDEERTVIAPAIAAARA
jgi:4-hydroxythreonine-4-phosphate dehydrogenase